ncbi:S-adenosyl-L-methionine-dependent methyltransferase [Lipomyces kononenkoae]|uniref:S-adenosyl-L-methionine-dependent methyltransferase n=1 Tax=Lipomyces kononenkoae TaxID=34357 RepID=A0ACC3T5W0_LIPKO
MGRRGRNDHPRSRDQPGGWVEIRKENAAFEEYYRAQNIVPEPEWNTFYDACRETLPVTFRITGTSHHDALQVRDTLVNEYVPFLKNITWEGEEVQPPSQLPWYPDGLAWQIKVGKTVIRKSKPFARFQRFLVVETDVGNISRQEAVSMIPPLLLDVQPDHAVIDLCAAPGSKTAQLIEAVHAVPEPTGIVVANDSDHKRSHMLIHQVKRLNSPNLVVTNHDAQLFPRIRIDDHQQDSYLRYDRVLCDVPCSGDGTMRKNINVWRDWSIHNALSLHQTQINILNRGLHLLKPGGKLVYSTCSLNPIENEAVVAHAVREWRGKVRIVDCTESLPGLVRRKGMTSWKVMGKDKQWKDDAAVDDIRASCFVHGDEAELGIENCMRIYPHDQNTGGFFITLLEKAAETAGDAAPSGTLKRKAKLEDNDDEHAESDKRAKPDESDPVATLPEEPTTSQATATAAAIDRQPLLAKKKERLPRDANEEPFKFLPPDHPAIENCWSFYSIADDFSRTSLLVRNATGEPVRTIYYVHPRLQPVIALNDTRVKFIHAGIKLFAYQKTLEGSCPWRVQSEGMTVLYRHIARKPGDSVRVVRCGLDTLRTLCDFTFPKFNELEDKEFLDQLLALTEGCVFLEVDPGTGDKPIVFPMWRGRGSVNLMLPKQDTAELLLRVFKVENVGDDGKKKTELTRLTETTDITPADTESEAPSTADQTETDLEILI